MLNLRIILYMPYIDKVLCIHAMYRYLKTIFKKKSSLYIPCTGKIILCIVNIRIWNKKVVFRLSPYMPYIDKAFFMFGIYITGKRIILFQTTSIHVIHRKPFIYVWHTYMKLFSLSSSTIFPFILLLLLLLISSLLVSSSTLFSFSCLLDPQPWTLIYWNHTFNQNKVQSWPC